MYPSRVASLTIAAAVFVFLPVPRLAAAQFNISGPGIVTALLAMAEARVQQAPATPVADPVDIGDANKGLVYAQKVCSECHNVLKTDAASPNPRAPSFKKVANTPGMSITALTVWSRTSHPTMPNLVIEPADMDHLIAYILSLRNR
jgi:mono/diheme cytochrome c family protein